MNADEFADHLLNEQIVRKAAQAIATERSRLDAEANPGHVGCNYNELSHWVNTDFWERDEAATEVGIRAAIRAVCVANGKKDAG